MASQSTYTYKARDAQGKIISGSIVASSAQEVGNRLRAEGKYILNVLDRPMSAQSQLDTQSIIRNEAAKRVRREDVIAFCQQLSVMLETGVPLTEALDAFCRQMRRKEFRAVLEVLRDDVFGGEPFSVAMGRWPRVFPPLMISLMAASEASGTLSLMLRRVGEYLAKERKTMRQIRGALSYPLFMMGTGLVMTVLLMAFVLPRFATIYETRSASLPLPTQMLMSVSEFVTGQYMYYGPTLAIVFVASFIWLRTVSGRRFRDWMKLNLPVLRVMFGQLYITRFSRTMATLLSAGVNLLDIIDICRGVTRNTYYDQLWQRVEQGVRDGRQMSDAIRDSAHIPPNVASMIASGERSGRLADVMERVAEYSEEELDAAVKQTTAFVEPCMIIFMGVVIGGVAMALLLPVFSMGKVMAGG